MRERRHGRRSRREAVHHQDDQGERGGDEGTTDGQGNGEQAFVSSLFKLREYDGYFAL